MLLSKFKLHRVSPWLSLRFQYFGAVVICVLLPLSVANLQLLHGGRIDPQSVNAAMATFLSISGGTWLHRRLAALPGTRRSSGILPSYLLTAGIVFAAILLLRVYYTRWLLFAGLGLTIGWFYALYYITQRKLRLLIGVVEGGDSSAVSKVSSVDCVPLSLSDWPDGLSAVVADFHHDHPDAWEARLADFALAGVPVYHSKDLVESMTGRADLTRLSENNLGGLGPLVAFQDFKAILDRVVAVPVALVLLPVFIGAAIAIKLDSPGPVLFRQKRMGFRGRNFGVYKFRTMKAERRAAKRQDISVIDRLITRENDARITRVGRFLRRSRIDELPQVLNILRGEMSWIGPRPEASALSDWYEAEIPFYRYRHVVMPGITGWAQVNQGHVAEIDDIKTKLQYDFFYIRNFSIWLDLLIVIKTIRTILTGYGHK